jgi:hypothetical protein
MKATVKVTKEVEIKWLWVSAEVRHWEDATVNGIEDAEGTLIPCRKQDCWEPWIDIDTGIIKDWPKGTTAEIHYKVCDAGVYDLVDEKGDTIISVEDYVPTCLCPEEQGFGDYIIMSVNEDGQIQGWKPFIDDLIGSEE